MKKFDLYYLRVCGQRQDPYEFLFVIHQSQTIGDHQIEDEFYSGNIPQELHFEAEIREKEMLELDAHQFRKKLHIHQSTKTNKYYVCWTGAISNHRLMREMLEMWSTGSVYTMETGVQFEKILEEKKLDVGNFKACIEIFRSLGIFSDRRHCRFGVSENEGHDYHAEMARKWEENQEKSPQQ